VPPPPSASVTHTIACIVGKPVLLHDADTGSLLAQIKPEFLPPLNFTRQIIRLIEVATLPNTLQISSCWVNDVTITKLEAIALTDAIACHAPLFR
jgi:hypothetical protein